MATAEDPSFPDDSNGAVLRKLFEAGDNLTRPREFDFGAIFRDEDSALQYAIALLKNAQRVSLDKAEDGEYPWQVQCYPTMVPRHADISEFEDRLDAMAEEHGGCLNGWDCYVVKSST